MTTADLPFALNKVLFGPFELAIKSVLPLFDMRGGSIIGNEMCTTPFLTLTVIVFLLFELRFFPNRPIQRVGSFLPATSTGRSG